MHYTSGSISEGKGAIWIAALRRLTPARPPARITAMIHRVASVLLILALAAAASAPVTHGRVNRRRTARQRLDAAVHLYGHAPGTTTLVGDRRRHLSVAQLDDAVARPSVRVGTTPALVEVWEARIVPDLPGRAVPVAGNARPNRPSRVVLAARAPPV